MNEKIAAYLRAPSPSYVLDEALLRQNLRLIKEVQDSAGITIILAFKGFSMWSAFPIVREYIKGATASSLNEVRLCYEEMGTKAHTYAPAYLPQEFGQVAAMSSHITFNSIAEYRRYQAQVASSGHKISCGIRVNPEYSEVETDMYNPCAAGSRLGECIENFKGELPEGLEGLHFHALCESSSYSLEKTLAAFEQRFAPFFPKLKWVNMGGGHLMTRKGYDIPHLIALLRGFRERHGLEVILEPGSAFAWETGVLTASVLDIVESKGIRTAILDVSFTAHMPDTLEMPYRPRVVGTLAPTELTHDYRLGGTSCLAGDFMYEYGFERPLAVGDRLVFEDMIHYTMVKTTMFNGVAHPSIAILRESGELDVVRRFGYEDFKNRLS
jgi:carboxynorspermidine decarboxylase